MSFVLYSTFLRVSLLCCPEKPADPVCTDDRDFRRGVESLDLLSYSESRCLSFVVHSLVLSCFPALDLEHNIGSSFYPRLVNKPVRKYYLIHEWTCLFTECHHDAWHLLNQRALCMFIINPLLSQQYGMCRVLCFILYYFCVNTIKIILGVAARGNNTHVYYTN